MPAPETVEPPREHTASSIIGRLALRWKPRPAISAVILVASLLLIGWFDAVSGRRISYVLLYIVPVVLATLSLGVRAGFAAAIAGVALSDIGDVFGGSRRWPYSITIWESISDLLVLTLLVWFTHGIATLYREVDDRVRERTRDLQEANRARRQLERELLEVAARERSAIGQELHDDLCQRLVATAFATDMLAEELAGRDAAAAFEARKIAGYLDDSIEKARQLARGLLFETILPAELPDALARLASQGSTKEAQCRLQIEGEPAISGRGGRGSVLQDCTGGAPQRTPPRKAVRSRNRARRRK